MKALVVGLGVSGRSAVAFLERRGWDVVGWDDREGGKLPDREAFDLVVVSPGIPRDHPLYREDAIGEVELALRELQNPAIGITGTNGKTTTCLAVAHLLNQTGRPARALGNIGVPLTSSIDELAPGETAVVELSSFQLETAHTPAFDAVALLNIAPDHLDRYASFEEYAATKWRIADLRKPGGLLHLGDGAVEALAGAPLGEDFVQPPHRLEFVAEVDGVRYINDSKATNVSAVLHALDQVSGPVILIAGGRGKGESFDALRGRAQILAIGETAAELGEVYGTLERAFAEAVQRANSGMTVLLSPACASFDQFPNYEVRGDQFKALVKSLASGKNRSRNDEPTGHDSNRGADQCGVACDPVCDGDDRRGSAPAAGGRAAGDSGSHRR